MENERKSKEYEVPDIISRTASEVWDSTDSFSRRRSYMSLITMNRTHHLHHRLKKVCHGGSVVSEIDVRGPASWAGVPPDSWGHC